MAPLELEAHTLSLTILVHHRQANALNDVDIQTHFLSVVGCSDQQFSQTFLRLFHLLLLELNKVGKKLQNQRFSITLKHLQLGYYFLWVWQEMKLVGNIIGEHLQ